MAHPTEYTDALARRAQADIGWGWLAALGVIGIAGGVLALLNPFIASLTAEAIAGAAFLLGGGITIWMAFRQSEASGVERIMNGLIGVTLIAFAAILLVNPLAGLVSLTLLVAVFFTVEGILRIVLSLRMRDREGWGWITAAGAVSVALGVLIFLSLPAGAFALLGLFLGIDLIASGASSLVLAYRARQASA